MTDRPESCDPDDVVCQMTVLHHLRGLESQLGHDEFTKQYPEAEALRQRLPDVIADQEAVVQQSINACIPTGPVEEQLEVAADVRDRALDQIQEVQRLAEEADGE